ncbi:hypothetical protein KXD93_22685 [Mucilaginibacter sp. BJC16-A38]|uniref:hypothetical protein n=1 Tax=Mucilaginibacter phenanthrenivorans TaxID=1234842 RepID=UPI002157FAD0|nr:hypothetical protein [Mucilaginibacter phenanthrenivorans]MCR8560479.1 hypothetical protein [Mucilaginibacter phenanthrenivorans]
MKYNIYVSQNDHEILDYITDAGIKHSDDDSDRVFTFLFNDHFHLVIFFSSPGDKGFIMFRIDDIRNNLKEVKNLKIMLQELARTIGNKKVLNIALAQVEDIEIAGVAAQVFRSGK